MEESIVIVGGLPGTGKTTLAELLAKEIGATLLSKDNIEAAIVRSGVADSGSLKGAGYEIMAELAQSELSQGRSVVLDCIASAQRVSEYWANLITEKPKYIECICSDISLHKNRIDCRVRSIKGWYELTWANVEEIRESYRPFSESRLILDSVESPEENINKALTYVRKTCM